MDVINYTLTDDTIEEEAEALFGSENRLVVQPLGGLFLSFWENILMIYLIIIIQNKWKQDLIILLEV